MAFNSGEMIFCLCKCALWPNRQKREVIGNVMKSLLFPAGSERKMLESLSLSSWLGLGMCEQNRSLHCSPAMP